MRRYVMELAKNLGLLIGGLTSGFITLFAIVDVCLGGAGETSFVLIAAISVGLLCFLAVMVPATPFVRMIRRQELDGLRLDDAVQRIDRGIVGTYLGDAWLIQAGHVALHHSRIASVHVVRTGKGTAASMSYIRVKTVEGQYYRWAIGSGAIRKVRAWLKDRKAGKSSAKKMKISA